MSPEEMKHLQELAEGMERFRQSKATKPAWKDPTCPKCGIALGNRMAYACGESYCPSGLN